MMRCSQNGQSYLPLWLILARCKAPCLILGGTRNSRWIWSVFRVPNRNRIVSIESPESEATFWNRSVSRYPPKAETSHWKTRKCPTDQSYLLIAFLTKIRIGSIEQFPDDILFERFFQILTMTNIDTQQSEILFTGVTKRGSGIDPGIRERIAYRWGQSLQIFWSAKVPPKTVEQIWGRFNDFNASSTLSTTVFKNSTASCWSRKFTGSPENLCRAKERTDQYIAARLSRPTWIFSKILAEYSIVISILKGARRSIGYVSRSADCIRFVHWQDSSAMTREYSMALTVCWSWMAMEETGCLWERAWCQRRSRCRDVDRHRRSHRQRGSRRYSRTTEHCVMIESWITVEERNSCST